MRLCNALIHYFLFLFLSLSISQCYGNEHHNHADPVTTKYSQSAASIDPLNNDIDTTNVHKHNDDDHHHLHDTIEARLKAKHNLRQSVHQHGDDDKHENEEDYINRLNSALEDNYNHEHQFQYVAPPVVEIVNNTKLKNQTNENIEKSSQIQNDTTPSLSTSIQTPTEEKQSTTDELTSTEDSKTIDNQKYIQNLDENTDSKISLEKTLPPLELKTNQQQNIIQEDLLFIHKETLSSTQSYRDEDTFDTLKSTTVSTPSIVVQQPPPISDTVRDETPLDNNSSLDIKSSTPTQLQAEDVVSEKVQNISAFDSKQQTSDEIPSSHSTHLNSTVEQASDVIQNISSSDQNTTSITPIKSTEEQQKQDDLVQDTNSEQQPRNTNSVTQDTLLSQHINRKSEDTLSIQKESPTPVQSSTPPTPPRILRSQTAKLQKKVQNRHNHVHGHDHDHSHNHGHDHSHNHNHVDQKSIKTEQEPVSETIATATTTTTTTEKTTIQSTLSSTEISVSEQPIESSSLKPHLETTDQPSINLSTDDETKGQLNNISETQIINDTDTQAKHITESPINNVVETQLNNEIQIDNITDIQDHDQSLEPLDMTDLPRQVHVHDPNAIFNELKEESHKNDHLSQDQEMENNSTASSFLTNDHSPHLPRILENEEISTTIAPTIEATTSIHTHSNSNIEDTQNSVMSKSNNTDSILPIEFRQVCWHLPKSLEPGFILIENQAFRFVNLLPEYIQAIFIGPTADREKLMNTIWFGSISSMCFFFSFIFLSMGAKRLKQSKDVKEIRARCQQLQQYNNQLELERATFEKQNQKLSDEVDELKNLPIRDTDEEIFDLREKYEHLYAEWQHSRADYDAALKDIDYKQSLIQKHDFEMQKQVERVAYLDDEILRQKQELEKDRETIARLQSNDLSLERFETLQQTIQDLKAEISQLKQDKFAQLDELQSVQEQTKQLDLDNNQLTIKMKQLKDLLQQRDETIKNMRNKVRNNQREDANNNNDSDNDVDDDDDDDDGEEKTKSGPNSEQNQKELLSKIDDDVEKANQHLRDLHSEVEEKTRRIKDLDSLLNQERDRCRELETKLKVVLELRERDAHLHIRQLGQTDAELRKARTDTERVRILQQQLHLKEQQLEDVQKVLNSEQTKFSEECSKLQHEIHEKWMEVKKLTRELDGAKKECESLRRQISKYGSSERSSQEKTMHKPVPQHMNTSAGRVSSEPETNGNSPPPPIPYQQGDNFRPIDHERNDSGAASPSEMFRMRPPLFGLPRPPFYPPPFLPPHPHNPFMMGARFPMPVGGPLGVISPIPHLMTNGSGGSDANSFEIVDSANITPNSISYDPQLNGSAVSPTPDGEQQATTKVKKPKKSLKKKSKTSNSTVVASAAKEDV
ncbi:hypothetical protein I4U23_007373 [Adineta vaga]|nr:hypothetical protein I4U23_007373 [Adineta vaga]